jgi:hypothetical protein
MRNNNKLIYAELVPLATVIIEVFSIFTKWIVFIRCLKFIQFSTDKIKVKSLIFIFIFVILPFKVFGTEGFELIYTAPVKTLGQKEFWMEHKKGTEDYIFHFGDLAVRKSFDEEDWQEQLETLRNSIDISFKDSLPIYLEVFGRIRMNMLRGLNFTPPELKKLAESWERALVAINLPLSVALDDCEDLQPSLNLKPLVVNNNIEFWNSPEFVQLHLKTTQAKDLFTELVDKAMAKDGFIPADSLFDLSVGKMKKDDPLGNPQKSTSDLLKEWMERKNSGEAPMTDSAPLNIGISKTMQYDKQTTISIKQESMAVTGQAGQSYLIGDKAYHSFLRKVGDEYKEFLSVDRVEMEVLHELNSSKLYLKVNGSVNYMSNESGLGKVIFDNWQRFEAEASTQGHGNHTKTQEVDANVVGTLEQNVREQLHERLDILAGYQVGLNLNNSWKAGSFATSRVEVGADVTAFEAGAYRGALRGTVYFSHDQFFDNNKTETIGAEISGRIFQKDNQVLLVVAGANNNLQQADQDQKIFAEVNSYFGLRSMIKF